MVVFQMSLNPKREELFRKLTEIPEAGRKSKSELVEMALEEFILKHGKSNNPQTQMDLFEDNMIKAIPNLYADVKEFKKFYNLIKTKEEYQRLDEQINMLLKVHNGILDRVH